MPAGHGSQPEALLIHADWVRRLATSLVYDPDRVEDVVQETWLAALRRPPRHDRNLRSWLGDVVRNIARSTGRAEARRRGREEAGAKADVVADTADLVEQAALQRELVGHVLGLAEPYRSVLLLRYFENLPPRQIARRLDVPVDTVKTRLQRALDRVRVRLDKEYGARRTWALALLPLAREIRPPLVGRIASAPVGWKAAGAVVLGLVAIVAFDRARSDVSAAARNESTRNGQHARTAEHTRTRAGAAADATGSEGYLSTPPRSRREAPAGLAAGGTPLAGRVVDVQAQPLAKVLLRWNDPRTVRWADDAETVVTGPSFWLEIPPDVRARLRTSPAELDAFVVHNFAVPEVGRALILGSALPELVVSTDLEGRFFFMAPMASEEVTLHEPDRVLLGEGRQRQPGDEREERWLVAAEARTLHGRVVDEAGAPRGGARVEVAVDLQLLPHFAAGLRWLDPRPSWTVRTDADGRFEIPGAPRVEGAWIHAQAEPFRTDPVPVPAAHSDEELVFVLPVDRPEDRLTLGGRVLYEDGAPAPRSTVALGSRTVKTDADGRFEIEASTVGSDADLVAFKAGFGAVMVEGYGERVSGLTGRTQGPTLSLPSRSLSISGVLVDVDGTALEDWIVELVDPTFHPALELGVENAAAGRALGVELTDENGRFALDGLLARSYRVRARGPEASVAGPPVPAGTTNLLLRVVEHESWSVVRGRVVTRRGDPVPDVQVSLVAAEGHERAVPAGPGRFTTTDPLGFFELTEVRRDGSELLIGGPGVETTRRAIPEDGLLAEPGIPVPVLCRFRVELPTGHGANRYQIAGADGQPVQFAAFGAGTVRFVTTLARAGIAFPICEASDAAAELVLLQGELELERVPLDLRPGVLQVVGP